MLNYGKQDINDEDIKAVVEVLESDFLTQGPVKPEFEKQLSALVGASYCLAVNSATSALHVACLALDVGPGDLVWTSPISFVASANCALYCGAQIDFVDIDPKTKNICINALQEKLQAADTMGKLPKVVIPVHLAGNPVDMYKLKELAQKYNFKILEDASHALGAKHHGEFIGCGDLSDITVFSFHPVKMITTGEGGAATTNNDALYFKMLMLSSHGITREKEQMIESEPPSWYYEQQLLGFNYRMTDIQAALGISQLLRLEAFIEKRNKISTIYNDFFSKEEVQTPKIESYNRCSFHLYVLSLPLKTKNKQTEIVDFFKSSGIGVNKHYFPIYLQPFYKNLGFARGYCKNAETYYSTSVSLPIYPNMSTNDIEKVLDVSGRVIKTFVNGCDK